MKSYIFKISLLFLGLCLLLCSCQVSDQAVILTPEPEAQTHSFPTDQEEEDVIALAPVIHTTPSPYPTPSPTTSPIFPSTPTLAPTPPPAIETTPDNTPVVTLAPIPTINGTLYILMYHHVVEDGVECNNWTIPVSRLKEDLQWISDNGYTTVLPREIIENGSLPSKAVLITFDDGYTSNYELAYPLLQEYQAKAVISIVTDYIEQDTSFFLNWDMCREMESSGLVEIGSHTHNLHESSIIRLNNETQEEYEARVLPDIQKSIDLINQNLGHPPVFFAYPHGKTESWASDFLAEHFHMSVTTTFGPAKLSKGLYNLPRHNITSQIKASRFLG